MSTQPPKIDKRTYQEIVAQTEQLAQKFTQWRPHSDGKPDAGRALIRIFGRMAALVNDRINQAPEKNFLAFLDTIGTQILPPIPARVPLTFNLVSGNPTDASVPAGTQVAAPPIEEEKEEVVFETERKLALITAQLQAVFVREPLTDRYSDRTSEATGNINAAFKAFEANKPNEHYFFLACDRLLSLPENKTIIFIFYSTEISNFAQLPLSWSYWDGANWQALQVFYLNGVTWLPTPPSLTLNQREMQVSIRNLPVPARKTINGVEAAWLRVGLNTSIAPTQPLPYINAILAGVLIERNNLIQPDLCFFNASLLDLSKDFYPFGQQPRFNDTFYIGSQEIFAKPSAVVTIEVKLSGLPVNKNGGAELVWEVYNGASWEILGRSSVSNPKISGQPEFNDRTQAFTQDGQITFTLPAQIQPTIVSGTTNCWLRVRLIKGNYGTEATYRQTTNSSNQIFIEPVAASFAAPSVQSIGLKYNYRAWDALSACHTYNNFTYADRTAQLIDYGSTFQPLTPTAPTVEQINCNNKIQLFSLSTDIRPTLYLGFDRPFPNRAITLYFQVEPPRPGEIAKANAIAVPARVVWEYSSPTGWVPLTIQDETDALSERGIIQFIGPTNFSSQTEFGQSLYWLRARWESGEFAVSPQLRRILTNTTWASQTVTIAEEILGTSDGNPNQTYHTAQKPILLGQCLQVFEPTDPSLVGEKGGKGEKVEIVRNEAGQVQGAWVTWQEVPDFYGSGPRDRHYVLDRLAGEVRFGDGLHGAIPPQGFLNNIQLAPYRIGGGKRGNRPALTVTELKTTVPYVDSVTNLEPAAGGAEGESLERVKERGPKALRHRGRAVTVEDMEDLALEASTEVARALAIAPQFNPIDGLQWLPIYRINLDAAGEIKVETIALPDGITLEVNINGPGQSNPYTSKKLSTTNPAITYTVTQKQFELGREWSITFTNLGNSSADSVRAKITYLTGSLDVEFQAPSMNSSSTSNPYQGVTAAGRVELIIVPQSSDPQPTPSLSLLERVERYIRDRCSPAVDLHLTEPDWVEVTIRANIVPISLEKVDEIKQAATDTLIAFLHPLTGGRQGRGWDFGRRPHESDLYAVLEKVDGVDYVASLSIDSPSLNQLPNNRRNRFLIYSGAHQITCSQI
ncbi:baseplate J/gp47 family protein [Aerosakkonema funiforme]|uniref:Baseplate J/gp47 family protein n=1 Tax=Aerosakkonema funiforme FACHB-1375 TaxID=2949571 RepID=A0A926ZID4_9CYAN|nr:baseplate J/gp47 family protein [Aerosakkonema funiforme]MBD2184298.1 baseplate J/gp47 family protein [Aerosakkonema funiforme FACHB-1375]